MLQKCLRAHSPQADRAVGLWSRFNQAREDHSSRLQRRFLRRAYARARDQAVPWRPELH